MSTKSQILYYLKLHGQCSGSELEKQADNWLTKPSVISRRCRELANEGKIVRSLTERKTVQYALPQIFDANKFLESLKQPEQGALL